MKQTLFKILILLFVCLPVTSMAKTPNVVASIAPLNALAAGVMEGVGEPKFLLPPQASHHHYSLKPSDARALEQADVVIWIGPDLEIFLEKVMGNLNKNTDIITIEQLPGLTLYPIRHNQNWEAHADHEHPDSHYDPHIWLEPQNAIVIIRALADHLSKDDPDHEKIYQSNATSMVKQILTLDQELTKELTPIKDKPFLVFHDGYQYFEKHYHLNGVGAITLDPDLPPSAKRLSELRAQITQDHIQCMFAEPATSSSIIETLQRDTGIHVGKLDTMGNGQHFKDYLDLLQLDANALRDCLTLQK